MGEIVELRPQPGPQEQFLASPAFLVVYGGGRGGGKTFGLVSDAARHVRRLRFRAKLFRRLFTDLTDAGGVWDEAMGIYPRLATPGIPNLSTHSFVWPTTGASVSCGHFQDERAAASVQGKQFDRVGVDEAAQLEWSHIWSLVQSTRTGPSRVQPRMRLTVNPPGSRDHWLIPLVEPYLTPEGYADRSKSGQVRWFRVSDTGGIEWVPKDTPHALSFAFVPALLEDNKILTERDPSYESRLMNLVSWERERMLHGNWYSQPRGGMFRRDQCRMIDAPPGEVKRWIRYWDQAGTEPGPSNPNPDYTAGALVGLWRQRNALVIADMRHFRCSGAEKRQRMKATAEQDGRHVEIGLEQEPASSGKDVAERMMTEDLLGYTVHIDRPVGDKAVRASPWLAWLETGNVYVVRGPWNAEFFGELEAWPAKKKDQIDGVSGGFKLLSVPQPGEWRVEEQPRNDLRMAF